MAEQQCLDLPGLFSVTMEKLRRNWILVAGSVAVLLAADEILDRLIGPDEEITGWLIYLVPSMILTIIMQYMITRSVLRSETASADGDLPRFGVYFCMAVLTSILMALGFFLLIVPGVYVMSRWMLAGPIILCEKKGVLDSMNASWERMETHVWPMFWALFLLYVVGFGLLSLPIFLIDEETIPTQWVMLLSGGGYLISILACLLAVGVYCRLPHSDASQ